MYPVDYYYYYLEELRVAEADSRYRPRLGRWARRGRISAFRRSPTTDSLLYITTPAQSENRTAIGDSRSIHDGITSPSMFIYTIRFSPPQTAHVHGETTVEKIPSHRRHDVKIHPRLLHRAIRGIFFGFTVGAPWASVTGNGRNGRSGESGEIPSVGSRCHLASIADSRGGTSRCMEACKAQVRAPNRFPDRPTGECPVTHPTR